MSSKIKKFYDPHPGFAGADAPIPPDVKRVADELDGQVIRIEDALRKIRAVTGGKVEADEKHGCVFLWTNAKVSGRRHIWRVIRFKDPGVLGGGA